MANSLSNGPAHEAEIRLLARGGLVDRQGYRTGVTTKGPSRTAALENLDKGVALHEGDCGGEPTDEERREVGIDSGDREQPGCPHLSVSEYQARIVSESEQHRFDIERTDGELEKWTEFGIGEYLFLVPVNEMGISPPLPVSSRQVERRQ